MWGEMVSHWPPYDDYQQRTGRAIPVVVRADRLGRCSTTSRPRRGRGASERFYTPCSRRWGSSRRTPTASSPSGTTSRSRRPRRAPGDARASTSASPRPSARTSTSSGAPAPRPATATTARPGRGPSTARTTTARSCSTPTATASRPCTTAACARGGDIDHVWIRVADVAAPALLRDVAPHAGFALGRRHAERAQFAGASGSFSVVAGRPTGEPAHGVRGATTRPSTRSTRGDRGRLPRQRRARRAPQYHPGYYGAFVLDPDGNNVEVVNHNR